MIRSCVLTAVVLAAAVAADVDVAESAWRTTSSAVAGATAAAERWAVEEASDTTG